MSYDTIEMSSNTTLETGESDILVRLSNLEFDIKVLEAMLLNKDFVVFPYFVLSIRNFSDGVELTLQEIPGFPLQRIEINSTIFYQESVDTYTMRKYFRNFDDANLICSNLNYRILSSIKINPLYKCIAYVLMLRIRRVKYCAGIINDIKRKGDQGIYKQLRKLMDMVLDSQFDLRRRRMLPVIQEGRSAKKRICRNLI